MWILVHHDGQQLGPFNEDEVRAALQTGRFRPSDLAWVENTPAWVPVESLFPGALNTPGPASTPPFQKTLSPYPYTLPEAPTSALAILSFVLGIMALLLCFSFVTGIPAIICGHAARNQIDRGHIRQQGSGLALAGMIMGYIATLPILLVAIIAIPAAFFTSWQGEEKHPALPPPAATQKARLNAPAPSIAEACRQYAQAHHGTYPKTLEALIPRYLPDGNSLLFPQLDQPGAIGFWYFGDGSTNPPADSVLLVSRGKDAQGRRMIVRVNGTSSLEQSDMPKGERE